ncbi:hypothetical protein DE169_000774 [Clostridium acetobutylicum]|nr:hypothetical protein [Clostridium acetobutylicum]NOW13276.1 hypothetical protein [Clostridium acetobutylicum]NRY55653.1 hypothetical protein [Clostridium acetobutylicum]
MEHIRSSIQYEVDNCIHKLDCKYVKRRYDKIHDRKIYHILKQSKMGDNK